jgi:hypothetical protein
VASSDRGLNGGTRPCLFRRPRPLVQNLGDIFNQRQKLTRKLAFQPSLASLPQTDESCMKAAQWFQSNLNSRRERSKKQASQEQQHLRKIVFEIADSGQSLLAVNSGHHAEPELLVCSFHHKAPAPCLP